MPSAILPVATAPGRPPSADDRWLRRLGPLLAFTLVGPLLSAQDDPLVLEVRRGAGQDGGERQGGVAVQMFESPTLARFLRKAQDFLARDDHAAAITVIQRVLEGDTSAGGLSVPEDGAEQGADPSPSAAAERFEIDARLAVFSADGRLYRPVIRLCHELLAGMPPRARELYRQRHEVAAERALDAAIAARDVAALEAVAHRWFVTRAAARAMLAASDLLMHRGRYRSALQTLRLLLDVYPADQREEVAAVDERYLRLRIALCLAASGERARAREQLAELADVTLRVGGELVPGQALARREPFAATEAPPPAPGPDRGAIGPAVAGSLVPLWMHGYAEPEPYLGPREPAQRHMAIVEGVSPAAPRHDEYVPGTSIRFAGDQALFSDHQRLRRHEVGSGLVRARSDGREVPHRPRQGQARERVPVYDWVAARVATDDERVYVVQRPADRVPAGALGPILDNEIAAFDRWSLQPAWRSSEHGEVYEGVTFLATPTVAGDRLLVPVLVEDAYALQALAAGDGAPLWRVPLHMGGSRLARAPALPVVVHTGTAFVLTNAGTVAAVDADAGSVLWIRRYERTHPLRPSHRLDSERRTHAAMWQYFREVGLTGFVPGDPILVQGRLVITPSDGDAVLCLDAASGELLWALPVQDSRGVPESGVYAVGHDGEHLFLCGDAHLLCVELRTGIRLWQADVPDGHWTGRGTVGTDLVLLPGDRCLWALPTHGEGRWRRVDLPEFSFGTEPFRGPANVFVAGPYVAVCYESGIEVFGCAESLVELAQSTRDPVRESALLVQAGDLRAAIDVLAPVVEDAPAAPQAERLIAWTRDVVLALASHGARAEALALLDRADRWVPSRELRLRLQLLRVETFETLGEPDRVGRERQRLYAMMEGRGG